MHICLSVLDDCKNLKDSYGEICVRCNKCGRFKIISTEEALKEMENDERLTSEELQELIGCHVGINCDGWDCYTDCAFWNSKRCTFNDREDGE